MAACLLAAGGGPPARAATDAPRGLAYAGPALAGDMVVWGELYPDRSGAVLARAPSGRVRVLTRLPPMRGRATCAASAASPER